MNLQSSFMAMPGNGLEPSLQGVLPTKTPTTEERSVLFCCEQQFMDIKNTTTLKMNLSCAI
jgi:hypothetical protein